MKYAVMQPYLFPYLGYYQLVESVNSFVFYDDVNYIKRGFINRNNILLGNQSHRFTVPVLKASQNKLINELVFIENVDDILTKIELAYKKAPFFSDIFRIVQNVLCSQNRSVDYIASNSISSVFKYLERDKAFYLSSNLRYDRQKSAADKLIAIGNILHFKKYVNSLGGIDLYKKDYFLSQGIDLSFIHMNEYAYNQSNKNFVPNLSMIDVLMWNSPEEVNHLLGNYEIR
jgi:hypothetical protein